MSQLSIAIIKKESATSTKKEPKYEYLIIKELEAFKFFDVEVKNVIGGSFDFSAFKTQIIEYFELPKKVKTKLNNSDSSKFNDDDEIEINFKNHKLFKFNKEDNATAYEYELSDKQFEFIDKKTSESIDKWGNISWKNEDDLKSLEDKWTPNQKFIFEKEEPFKNPKFSNDFRASLTNIVKANSNGKLVIFAGAGVSVDSGVPAWSALIDELKSDLDNPDDDFLITGQLYHDIRGNKEYQEKIQEILKFGKTQFNQIHKKIVELKPIHIVTTNYDTHFEQVISSVNSKYSIIKKDSDLPYSKGESLLIKMHGDFEQRNIVLKASDYKNYSKEFPLIEGYMKGIFASKLVLFIGFSFNDPNLKSILESVNEILKDNAQKPYILVMPRGTSKDEIEKIKVGSEEKGLKALIFEEEPVNEYYNQIKDDKIDESISKDLGTLGQKVFRFLSVVKEFNITAESLENLNIKNQFINSILRFKELGFIHPKVIESIYPFKVKSVKYDPSLNAEFDYDNLHLQTSNEDLLSFLTEKKGRDKEIDFLTFLDNKQSTEFNEFNTALKLLCQSGISCIIRKSDTSPTHFKLNPINSTKKCNCLKCLLERSEYGDLFKELNIISNQFAISGNSQISELALAYIYHKTGQHVKSFYVLESLKISAWNRQKYITYFIAHYNQKLLYSFMWHAHNRDVSEKELEFISQKIEQIDLDVIWNELPVDEDVRLMLKYIKEDTLFESTLSETEDNLIKIRENYKKYKKGGFRSWGSTYWYQIETRVYLLCKFYTLNLLFKDDFGSFTKLINLYVESIMVSLATSDKYEQKIKEVSSFFVFAFVEYATPKNNKKLLLDYKIDEIDFQDFEAIKKEYLEEFESFLTSGYRESTLFSVEIYENKLYKNTLDNSNYFEQKVKEKFNNFLILLTKFKLSDDEANRIIVKILNYLSVNDFFNGHNSLEYFADFIVHYVKLFYYENLVKIANYIISDNIWSDDLIEIYCQAVVNKQDIKELLNQDFYSKMLNRCVEKRKWSVSIDKMIPFYCLLEAQPRLEFGNKIKQSILKGEFRDDIIMKSYNWGVWNPIDDKDILNKLIQVVLTKSKQFPDYVIEKNGFPDDIQSFSVWNLLHFTVGIIYKHDLVREQFMDELYQDVGSKMFKWILKPTEFNYDDFQLNWLICFKNKNIINKIREIDSLKLAVEKGLKIEFNETVAKIYYESF